LEESNGAPAWSTAPELTEATDTGFTVIYVVSLEDVMFMSVQLTVSMLKNADCISNVTIREKHAELRGEKCVGKHLLARPVRNGRITL